ncbi:fatty acid desaturase family protein [Roseibium aquae]|uniref:fatty acid desaturase family protein n=1 Tax=Roseibium aquae TaxID=1323746 RepID=UPI001562CA80|nr:fatty acid desaturase [Roseibium aquae]
MKRINPKYEPIAVSKILRKDEYRNLAKKNDMVATAYLLYHTAVLFFLGTCLNISMQSEIYSLSLLIFMLYCSAFNFLGTAGAMHEFSHNTVFTQTSINSFFFKLLGILTWTNASMFKATHLNHHRNFLFEDDLEGTLGHGKRLKSLEIIGKIFFSPSNVSKRVYYTILSALGTFKNPKLKSLLDEKQKSNIQIDALSTISFHSLMIYLSYSINSYYPVLLLTVPSFIAQYPTYLLASSQHNVEIGEANKYTQLSASVSMNLPFFLRALYWNMNFHSEHHLAPAVPHYNLRKLQQALMRSPSTKENLNIQSLKSEMRGNYVKN